MKEDFPWKIQGPLESPSEIDQSFRVRRGDGEVEFELRHALGDSDQDPRRQRFLRELAFLARMDHGIFPPILDRGILEGRPFAVLPLRSDPALVDLEESQLSRVERLDLSIRLAGALAHVHRRGHRVPTLDPRHLTFRLGPRTPSLPRPYGAPAASFPGASKLPEGLGFGSRHPFAQDCIRWALLVHWLFFSDASALDPQGALRGVKARAPDLPEGFAEVVETLLDPEASSRPQHGGELFETLRRLSRQEDSPDPSDPKVRRPGPPVSELIEVVRAEIPSAPPLVDPESAPPRGRISGVQKIGLGLGAAFLVVLGLLLSRSPPGLEVPAPTFQTADSGLKALAQIQEVEVGEVPSILDAILQASARRTLPRRLDDPIRITRMTRRATTDPAATAALLEGYLKELRQELSAASTEVEP